MKPGSPFPGNPTWVRFNRALKSSLWFVFLLFVAACGSGSDQSAVDTSKEVTGGPDSLESTNWELLERVTRAHLRGLSVVNDNTVWASGTGGSVLRTIDGGQNWQLVAVPGAEKLDFRDIHAWDSQRAIVMSSGEGVFFYRTEDGGATWALVYQDKRTEVFFDALDFANAQNGMAYGDPINGRFQVLTTQDGGLNWQPMEQGRSPLAQSGSGGFAASGTGLLLNSAGQPWIATGGARYARVIDPISWQDTNLGIVPLRAGGGSGIYSMAMYSPDQTTVAGQEVLIAIGGNYLDSTNTDSVCAYSRDAGASWNTVVEQGPRGYRSGVAISDDGQWALCVGRTGSDYSTDLGITWHPLGEQGFYACAIGKNTAWATGRFGIMARLTLDWIAPKP